MQERPRPRRQRERSPLIPKDVAVTGAVIGVLAILAIAQREIQQPLPATPTASAASAPPLPLYPTPRIQSEKPVYKPLYTPTPQRGEPKLSPTSLLIAETVQAIPVTQKQQEREQRVWESIRKVWNEPVHQNRFQEAIEKRMSALLQNLAMTENPILKEATSLLLKYNVNYQPIDELIVDGVHFGIVRQMDVRNGKLVFLLRPSARGMINTEWQEPSLIALHGASNAKIIDLLMNQPSVRAQETAEGQKDAIDRILVSPLYKQISAEGQAFMLKALLWHLALNGRTDFTNLFEKVAFEDILLPYLSCNQQVTCFEQRLPEGIPYIQPVPPTLHPPMKM